MLSTCCLRSFTLIAAYTTDIISSTSLPRYIIIVWKSLVLARRLTCISFSLISLSRERGRLSPTLYLCDDLSIAVLQCAYPFKLPVRPL